MKIHPVGAELFQSDGQRSMTKVKFAIRNSVKAPKNYFLGFLPYDTFMRFT
jgi:hypothetical protein